MLNHINKEILTNMKPGGNKDKVSIYRLVKSELINNQKITNPKKEIDVVKSYLKKLKKAIKSYHKDSERYQILEKEINIVSELLPEGPSLEYIELAVDSVIQNIITIEGSIESLKHRGRIIGSTKKAIPDADGSVIAEIVNKKLEKK